MLEYRIPTDVQEKMRKKQIIYLAIHYTIATVVFSLRLLHQQPAYLFRSLLALMIIFFVIMYFYYIKRYKKGLDETRLTIDGELIRMTYMNLPEKKAHFYDIREVKERKGGLTLLGNFSPYDSIFITKDLENFEEIEKLLLEKTSQPA